MMPALSHSLVTSLAFVALVLPQVALTLWFVAIVRRRTHESAARGDQRASAATVPAEVILCLRGCDATLEEVFAALAAQSHRAWRLRVVVDSIDDPAWAVAQAAVARLTAGSPAWREHVIEPLAARPTRGSLKCASLRQALRSLASDTRVVALIDADSVVGRDWLLTMVDECLRPGVGAVSGNRWYDPERDAPAAVVRALWNAGAIVQMTTFGIPWGGSLAVRREALDDCGWADVIESTLCEDTALAEPLARAGWKYRFVPALMAVDRDAEISFGPLARWIARQLLTARLHHPSWALVATHGVATSLALAASAIGCLTALGTGDGLLLGSLVKALGAYEAINVLLLVIISAAVRNALRHTDAPPATLSVPRLTRWVALIPVTQAVYAWAMMVAQTTRAIDWRGVTYRIIRHGGAATVKPSPPCHRTPPA